MTRMQNTYYKTIADRMNRYRKQGFSNDQLNELKLGLEHEVNVEAYADKEYFAVQMRQIRFGLEEGLDVSLYNSHQYDWFQMEEIRKGLKDGIDASIYADPKFSYEVMRELRKALKDGIHLEKYAGVGAEMLRELHRAILDKQNIMPYIKAGYVPEQLREIRHAMKQGCNIDPYLNTVYRGAAIREITEGLEEGLDVSVYADPEYSWQQMREIRLGLEAELDVNIYSKVLYSWQQMREIRLGLEEGLDVESYKSMMHSAADMRKLRVKLEQERNPYIEPELMEPGSEDGMPEHIEEYCQSLPADAIRFFVESDKMKAYVYAGREAAPLSSQQLVSELSFHKIRKGLDGTVINGLVQGTLKDQWAVIARGQLPTRGVDGYYESFIGDEQHGIVEQPDGSLDCSQAYLFQKVCAGQKLLVYHGAEAGKDGYRIDGTVLHALDGKEQHRIRGRGFRILDDKRTYISEENGCAIFRDHNLSVTQLLELEAASNIMGNIDYNGSVYIKGDASGNIRIRASGDIIVEGFVENAMLESSGSILIKQGANGNGEAHISAGRAVIGRFFENATIQAEQIVANYFFRCNLYADKVIQVTGTGGSIAGGDIYAGHSVEVSNVGNHNGIVTTIRVGYNKDNDKEIEDYSGQLKEAEKQLRILMNALEEYKGNYPPEVRNTMPMFLKIENAIYTKQKELQDIREMMEQQKKEQQEYREAYLKVYGTLYEGTMVTINNATYNGDTITGIVMRNTASRMSVQKIKEKMR